eukprot:CAMPEP_0177417950 /NCGR_PEP_ID=MMETSP0368-20130122/68929_1 /TAXON_ID=447022 ORGANISM="Scrippsiella hangoei-like, Strain SHHI-4" /NCGR_SAMPLE_ID=MMETSP0368 /ASSEMBLY_ACC=CAM_ASM_000363 /LENGTH=103 /DNA_ID=CAMNT_0018887577 /DNA_START=381 /DNA_END=692 /DNA_ORIENTATION=-
MPQPRYVSPVLAASDATVTMKTFEAIAARNHVKLVKKNARQLAYSNNIRGPSKRCLASKAFVSSPPSKMVVEAIVQMKTTMRHWVTVSAIPIKWVTVSAIPIT